MMRRSLACLLTGLALAAPHQFVKADVVDTPLSIYDLARENDPEIRAAFAALQAERETKNQSTGALKPTLLLSGEVGANREDVDTNGVGNTGESSYDSHNLRLMLRQPLYRKDLFTELDITASNIAAAESEYKSIQQDLISRVLETYFKALTAVDNLAYLTAERDAIEEQLTYTKKRYKVGKTTVTDYLEAQAAYDLADAEVIDAQDQVKDSLDAIEEITGVPPQKLAPLGRNFTPLKPDPQDPEHWVEIATQNNPGLVAARFNLQASRSEVDRSKADHYPRLDVIARVGTEETGGRFGDSQIDDAYIGLQLEFPIYEGGQTSSRVKEARSRQEEALEKLHGVQRSVIRETNKVYRNTMTALNRIEALEVAVKSTETALDSIRAGYNAGTRTNADLLRAQRELYKARVELAAAKYQYTANYFQLKNITGTLTEKDVELIDAWFRATPDNHAAVGSARP